MNFDVFVGFVGELIRGILPEICFWSSKLVFLSFFGRSTQYDGSIGLLLVKICLICW